MLSFLRKMATKQGMMAAPSSASSEKPEFPDVAQEADTEVCDLLLTLDDVAIYSDEISKPPPKDLVCDLHQKWKFSMSIFCMESPSL
jgi:hypothetical protein